MLIIIGIFTIFLLLLISIEKPKFFFLFSICMILIWPSFIVIKSGGLPGVTPDRIFIFLLLFVVFLNLGLSHGIRTNFYKNKKIIIIFLIYFIWILFSSIIGSEDPGKTLFSAINWFVTGPFLAIFVLLFMGSEKDSDKIIVTIIIALLFINFIGIIEITQQKPMFTDYLITKTDYTSSATEGGFRDGAYRIQSVFSNPLVYAQFLVASIPLYLYVLILNRNFFKYFIYCCILITYVLVYYTGSRSGLMIAIIFPLILYYIKLYQKQRNSYKLHILNYLIFPSLIIYIGYNIYQQFDMVENMHYLFMHNMLDSGEISNLARVRQIKFGIDAILEQPFTGYGMLQAANAVGLSAIDNYYLSIILDTGIIGLLVFIYMIGYVLNSGFHSINTYRDRKLILLMSAIIIVLTYFSILSIQKGNTILYILIAIIFLRQNLLTEQVRSDTR